MAVAYDVIDAVWPHRLRGECVEQGLWHKVPARNKVLEPKRPLKRTSAWAQEPPSKVYQAKRSWRWGRRHGDSFLKAFEELLCGLSDAFWI